MRQIIQSKRGEFVEMGKQIKLELMKYEIRKFTMEYSKKVAKEKKKLLNENEKITKIFETNPRNEHTISEDVYKRAKQDIEGYYREKTKRYILRSKCQIYEEG